MSAETGPEPGTEAKRVPVANAKFTIAPQGLTPEFIAMAVALSHEMNDLFTSPKWLPKREACDPRLDGLQAAVDSGDPQVIRDLVEATGVCFKGVFLDHAAALEENRRPRISTVPTPNSDPTAQ